MECSGHVGYSPDEFHIYNWTYLCFVPKWNVIETARDSKAFRFGQNAKNNERGNLLDDFWPVKH